MGTHTRGERERERRERDTETLGVTPHNIASCTHKNVLTNLLTAFGLRLLPFFCFFFFDFYFSPFFDCFLYLLYVVKIVFLCFVSVYN